MALFLAIFHAKFLIKIICKHFRNLIFMDFAKCDGIHFLDFEFLHACLFYLYWLFFGQCYTMCAYSLITTIYECITYLVPYQFDIERPNNWRNFLTLSNETLLMSSLSELIDLYWFITALDKITVLTRLNHTNYDCVFAKRY